MAAKVKTGTSNFVLSFGSLTRINCRYDDAQDHFGIQRRRPTGRAGACAVASP